MDVLEVILRKLRPETMKRMGIDSLFVKASRKGFTVDEAVLLIATLFYIWQ
jgi:hypothetical protein